MRLAQLSLKGRALRLLSGREHSRAELEKRLAQHESGPGELAAMLDELQAKGFISEQRVVESVIHRKAGKLGATRIRQELNAKGLDREVVAEAVAGLQASELARASALWRSKFGTGGEATTTDPKAKARQMRFLAARGFGGETIRRVMQAPADGLAD
jgi:regulatory protein